MDLNLAGPGQGAGEKKLNVVNFQGNFFPQFATQSDFRLLAFVDKTAGNAPTTVGTKFVFEQKNAPFIVKYKRARRDREAALADPDEPAAKRTGKIAPD